MTTVSVPCPTHRCRGLAFVSKSRYQEADGILRLRCEHGHVFDLDKRACPQCGGPMGPADRRPLACTACDYEGPRQD
jgi:hypothetical protein